MTFPRILLALVFSSLAVACAADPEEEFDPAGAETTDSNEAAATSCTTKYSSSSFVMEFANVISGRMECGSLCGKNLARKTAGQTCYGPATMSYSTQSGSSGIACTCSRICTTSAPGCAR